MARAFNRLARRNRASAVEVRFGAVCFGELGANDHAFLGMLNRQQSASRDIGMEDRMVDQFIHPQINTMKTRMNTDTVE